jgi:hypothetical protein
LNAGLPKKRKTAEINNPAIFLLIIIFFEMAAYDTVTQAINDLRQRGYTMDFNLEENCLVCHDEKFDPADFEIMEIYRFEGETDPADEAVVFAIESRTGLKGILVNAFGIYSEPMSDEMIKKLGFHKN